MINCKLRLRPRGLRLTPFLQLYARFSDPSLLDADDFFLPLSFSILAMKLNSIAPTSQFARQLRTHNVSPTWIGSLFTFGLFGGWE